VSQVSITPGHTLSRWFSAARLLILGQTLATVIPTVWHLPAAYQNLLHFTPSLAAFQDWNENQLQAAVKASGMAPGALASLMFAASLLCLVSFWGVAILLAWRKSDSWFGLLTIYILAGTAPGFSFLGSNVGGSAPGFFAMYRNISVALIWPTFSVLLYLFPDGRLLPRWTRWLAPLPYLVFFSSYLIDPKSIIPSLMEWLFILYMVGGIASQAYRYRRVSSFAQRQQTKWVVFALGILVVSLVITQAVLLLDPGLSIGKLSRFWFDLLGNYLLGVVVAALIPLSIGISILRYRLWDIDLIIRRTLLYAVLSGLLGLVYFGSVVLIRQVLGGLTGNSSAALILSTLLIAALFNPLRLQLQVVIDQRFYRPKYDASRVLDEFAAAARSLVELEALTVQLAAVVTAAVQPQGLNLWLRSSGNKFAHPDERERSDEAGVSGSTADFSQR
jgi:hypothetical protein